MGCDECGKWFHIGCVGIPANVYDFIHKSDGFNWNCKACRKSEKFSNCLNKLKEVVAEEVQKAIPVIVETTLAESNKCTVEAEQII